jgi:hypothetical protein
MTYLWLEHTLVVLPDDTHYGDKRDQDELQQEYRVGGLIHGSDQPTLLEARPLHVLIDFSVFTYVEHNADHKWSIMNNAAPWNEVLDGQVD